MRRRDDALGDDRSVTEPAAATALSFALCKAAKRLSAAEQAVRDDTPRR